MRGEGLEMTMRRPYQWFKSASVGVLLWACLGGSPNAADFYLKAAPMTKTMPAGGPTITMWGYVLCDATFTPLPGQAVQSPGPRLVVPPGDAALNIHVFNGLPSAGAETSNTSLVIPELPASMVPVWTDNTTGPRTSLSQRVRSFAAETLPGSSSVYSWTSLRPGTFLYESGTHPSIQVQMGLYGAVTIDAAAGPPAQAYPGVPYDNDGVLIFSEVDPAIHAAVTAGTYGPAGTMTSTVGYAPRYFFINGAPYPDTLSVPFLAGAATTGQRVLLRFLNPGEETHIPVLQDLYMTVVAEDGNPLSYPKQEYSLILEAGKTFDAIVAPTAGGLHGIFDRRLRLTNWKSTDGGMMTYLYVTGSSGANCPGAVGATFMLTKTAQGQIQFNWGDIPNATAYHVYQSPSASPAVFSQVDPTTPFAPDSGVTGAVGPMPAGSLVFFFVAGDTTTPTYCEGPQR
jgi:hypothetical protein